MLKRSYTRVSFHALSLFRLATLSAHAANNPTIIHPGRLRTSLGACEAPLIHTMLHLYSLWSLLYDEAGERSSRFAAASSSDSVSPPAIHGAGAFALPAPKMR